MSELESILACVKDESLRLAGLMEQSAQMANAITIPSGGGEVKSLEREMWQLERECRLFASPSRRITRSPSPERSPSPDLRDEILTTKEQLAVLKRQIEHITSPTSPKFHHSRQPTAEHHHHHYYYHTPDFPAPLSPPKLRDTPIHSKFFHELPTPPPTASSTSTFSRRHDRFNSSLSAWPHFDIEDAKPILERTNSHESIFTITSDPPIPRSITPQPHLKRSSSHESIFEIEPVTPRPSPRRSPRSSPLSSGATSSPTYLSASAYLRQNSTSSVLLLSSTRGKQSRGLSSRKSFWNLWDRSNIRATRGTSSLRNNLSTSGMGGRVVVCTEIDVGMLQDALEG